MDWFLRVNESVRGFVWGPVMLVLLMGVGVYFTVRLRFFQVTRAGLWINNTFGHLLKKKNAGKGSITPVQALTTALAATVGTGNIVGVATAIASGGPGAVFWMWVSAFFGMMTKYGEIVLSLEYRERNAAGDWVGGPMYYITKGLGKHYKWLAALFAGFGALCAFGIGNMTQVHSIASSIEAFIIDIGYTSAVTEGAFSYIRLAVGIIIAVLAGLIIIGGMKRIGGVTEKFVPVMSLIYIIGALVIVIVYRDRIGSAFSMIFRCAFALKPVAGGIMGYTVMQAMRFGIARGVFSNEAGLGSAPIAHAAADTDSPVKQGFWGIFEVFIDTLVMCTLTALVIILSGVFIPGGELTGASLTLAAYSTVFGSFGIFFVTLSITLFAFSTVISWSLYGLRCWEYLFAGKGSMLYRITYIICIIPASLMKLTLVWDISDTLNGLMAIPNLVALIMLSGVVFKLTRDYLSGVKK